MSSVLPFIYHLLILLPGILIIYLLLKYDRFPEPKNLLIITVLLAFAGTTIFGIVKYKILLVHEWFPTYNEEIELTGFLFYFYNFIDAYILVAFGEELVKYLVILLFCVSLKEFNEPLDGLIYGAMAGLGFALEEGFGYLASAIATVAAATPESGGGQEAIFFAIMGRWMAIPAHVFFGIIMGWLFSIAIFKDVSSKFYLLLAILVPTLLHGTYDYILFTDLNSISQGLLYIFLYAGMLAWVVGLYVHYHGLQRLKNSETERRFNLII